MIYLDNAATTYKKPKAVIKAASKLYGNAGRGGHKIAARASEIVYECREELAELFTILDPSRIAFTKNATEAINTAILGVLKEGDHVVISSMEHNAVARCVYASGADFEVAKADNTGYLSINSLEDSLKENTKLVCINHVSNVNGVAQDIKSIGKMLRNKGILFLVDAAQSAGVCNINCLESHIDFLAFPGHKSLYGLGGTGGLYVRDGIDITPRTFGGTGSMSEDLKQPSFMPDSLESGSLNICGIASLLEGIKYVKKQDVCSHYRYLSNYLIEGLNNCKGVEVYSDDSLGVVAFNIKNQDSVSIANELSVKYNIAVRGGYHCAILAHETLGTDKIGGVVRASFSTFNKRSDADKLLKAVLNLNKC